jgi:hypothetical protein
MELYERITNLPSGHTKQTGVKLLRRHPVMVVNIGKSHPTKNRKLSRLISNLSRLNLKEKVPENVPEV